jgi:hypothetical protein
MVPGVRSESIEIRVTPEEKAELRATAERAGLAMTTWARMLVLREARSAENKLVGLGL